MSHYAVVDDFRQAMPQTVLAGGLRPRGIACHTTEGGEGQAGALGTIQFLIDAASRNASYHEIWYPVADGFEARRIVRPERAAHSMNPAQPPWSPNDRVRRILGDRWYDPNAYSYAVSIAGTTAQTVPALIGHPGFMEGARRRIAEIRAAYPSLNADPLYSHGEGQADRSDWGPLMRPALEDATLEFTYAPRLATALHGADLFDLPDESTANGSGLTAGPVAVLGHGDRFAVVVVGERIMWCRRTGLVNLGGDVDPVVVQRIADAFDGVEPPPADCSELEGKIAKAQLALANLRGSHNNERADIDAVGEALA